MDPYHFIRNMAMNSVDLCLKPQCQNLLKILFQILFVVMGVGFFLCPASAQDLDLFLPDFFSLKNITVGMGMGLAPDYEGADDFEFVPIPQMRYNFSNGCYLSLLGPSLRANMIPDRKFGFGPMLRYRPERDSVDDEAVDQFKKVDSAIEAGVFGSVSINQFLLYAAYNQDTSGAHDGYLIDVAGGYRMGIESNVQLIIFGLGTYAGEDYIETYFGVDAENARRSGLPEYAAEAGIKDVGGLVALQYKLDGNWAILGMMKFTRLLGDAADSPVVDQRGDANNFMDAIILNYSF